jgi:beta-lactamase regulating signal transducer with metallopeptidase domain
MSTPELVVNGLLQSLVVGTVVAILLWVGFRFVHRPSASTRAAAWASAILASVAVPAMSGIIAWASFHPPALVAAPRPHAVAVAHTPIAATGVPRASTAGARDRSSAPNVLALPRRGLLAIALVWPVAAGIMLLRLVARYCRLTIALRCLPSLRPEDRLRLEGALRRTGLRRRASFASSSEFAAPAVAGLLHPVIVVPPAVLEIDDGLALDRVVAHEAAHLARRDDYVDLAIRVALALGFFNPMMWFARRVFELEREIACDDHVVARCAGEREYARLLVRIASGGRPLEGLSLTSSARQLTERVDAILNGGSRRSLRSLPGVAVVAAIAAILWFLGAGVHLAAAQDAAASTAAERVAGTYQDSMLAGSTLHLFNRSGAIRVLPATGDLLTASAAAVDGTPGEKPLLKFSDATDGLAICALARSAPHTGCSEDVITGRPIQHVDWTVRLPAGRNIAIDSGAGEIVVRATGDVAIRNGDGNVDASGRVVDVVTLHGNIVAAFTAPSLFRSVTIDARDGSLSVTVPRDLRARIVATSFGQTIHSAIPLLLGKEPGYDALIGRAALNGASEREKLVLVSSSSIGIAQE